MDLRDFHDLLPQELRNEPEYPASGGEPREWIRWAEAVMHHQVEAVLEAHRERDRAMSEVQRLTVELRVATETAKAQKELLAAYKRVNDSNKLTTVHEPGATVYVADLEAEVEHVLIDRAGVWYGLGRVEDGRYAEFTMPARYVSADKPDVPLVPPVTGIDPRD